MNSLKQMLEKWNAELDALRLEIERLRRSNSSLDLLHSVELKLKERQFDIVLLESKINEGM